MYIFDEPSAGLHPLDSQKILAQLDKLIERDNSIIMIEHDSDCIRSADYVIDIGPGGGRDGGSLVFEGSLGAFLEDSISATARGIRDEGTEIESAPNIVPAGTLSIEHGACNSIKDLTLFAPLGSLVVVAGVSGAGKSSFLHGIVADTLRSTSESPTTWERGAISIKSSLPIERVIEVDQKPIGANSRSTPASYLKIFDHVRTVFSGTNEARSRGWGPGFFSYNSGNGRCPECKGLGAVKLEMSFLPDAQVGCETCQGLRYTDDALSVRYLGRTISEVLRSTFEEAKLLFANHRRIHHSLHLACELGLGYLTLGQSSTTLSGGESQRIKLVSELSSPRKGHSLYILDEPTTGLHKADVARLVKALRELVRLGNSVFVIEHDRDMILAADHVIEFGPGPGDNGGKVVFEGAPRKLRQASTNWGLVLRNSDNARPKPTTGKQSSRAVGTLADSSI
jgi:excinuclease ABC subunit A